MRRTVVLKKSGRTHLGGSPLGVSPDLRQEPSLEGALTDAKIAREHRDGWKFRGLGVAPPSDCTPDDWIRPREYRKSRPAGIDQ